MKTKHCFYIFVINMGKSDYTQLESHFEEEEQKLI
jgi:hypothetical protein